MRQQEMDISYWQLPKTNEVDILLKLINKINPFHFPNLEKTKLLRDLSNPKI